MKAVLMSLKPRWWEKILSGEKTLEIRKTWPKQITPSFTVYVYISGTGKIQGEFTYTGSILSQSGYFDIGNHCLTDQEIKEYGPDRLGWFCGWIIKNPRKYEKPLPLSKFGLERPPMSWQYIEIPDAEEAG